MVAACERIPAAELMKAVALTLGAEWRRSGRRTALTNIPGLEHWAFLTRHDLSTREGAARRPFSSLTRRQILLLGERRSLLPADLTPLQQQGLLQSLKLEATYSPARGPESLQLQSLFFTLHGPIVYQNEPPSREPPAHELTLWLPDSEGETFSAWSKPIWNLPLGVVRHPPRLYIVPPPRLSAWTRPAGRSAAEAGRYEQDPRLSVPVRVENPLVAAGLDAVAGKTTANFVAGTRLFRRPLYLKPGEYKARQILNEIERATGGTWRLTGDTYVLVTDPVVERISQLDVAPRDRWVERALLELKLAITGEQHDRLRKGEKLLPEELTARQRDALAYLATVLFASRPQFSAEALELKGVELEATELQPNRQQRVKCLFPAHPGNPPNILTFPLD